MTTIAPDSRNTLKTVFGVLAGIYAITFFLGAVLHLGVQVPVGGVVISELKIIPATIVETLCGLALAAGAYAVLSNERGSWTVIVGAHAFAASGVTLGMAAIALGAGPGTDLNAIYHRVMLTALVAGLVVLFTPAGRAAFGRGDRESSRG